jgi:hypothetical protein
VGTVAAAERWLADPGLPDGMPFVLRSDRSPDRVSNRWLASLPTHGCRSSSTWRAYALNWAEWARFLGARGVAPLGRRLRTWRQVLDPLLAGALFHVETAGGDILAARDEHRRLSAPDARGGGDPASPAENLQRLAKTLDEYRRGGRPLPLVRDLPPETVTDPLAPVNLRLLARQACIARLSRLTLSAEQRELLLGALDDLGVAPGGLRTPITEVTPFGTGGPPAPWQDPIGPWECGR